MLINLLMLNFRLLIFFCLISLNEGRTSENLNVKLSDGSDIVGRYLTSDSGRGIRGFLSIPYAEPPVGELRFKNPVKKAPWKTVLMAFSDAPVCIQRDPFRRSFDITGTEDCLYLNVYTPEHIESKLPVMVYFHGGGLMAGSGNKMFYGPDFLLDHDVVFVGANFRLGSLGFLATEDDNCAGNFGLKDQVQALQWIKENIENFGGDPDSVTIFGQSAGGASVTYHMQSKLSEGLFHRGIAQSGTFFSPWGAVAHEEVALKRAKKLGSMMNCPNDNTKELIDCLRKVPASNITEALYDYYEWDFDPMVPFPPVIEHDHDGAFISTNPRHLSNMHGDKIPLMIGITSEEGLIKTGAFFNNEELSEDLIKNWDRALPISLYYDHQSAEKQQEISAKIDEFYFQNQKYNSDSQQNLTNMFTDAWFLHSMIDYLKVRFSNENHGDTYVYLFSHKGSASFSEVFQGGLESFYGTAHAEELQYLFPIRNNLPYFFSSIPTEEDRKLTKIITKLWVNFANTGNPTPTEVEGITWHKTSSFPLDFATIGNEMKADAKELLKMKNDFLPERANFWEKLKAHEAVEASTKCLKDCGDINTNETNEFYQYEDGDSSDEDIIDLSL